MGARQSQERARPVRRVQAPVAPRFPQALRRSLPRPTPRLALGSLILGLLVSPPAFAATYYVATDGSDSNPCLQSSPCQSIAHGITLLRAGDTLYLRGGIYGDGVDSDHQSISSGTSWTNAITIAAYPGNCGTQTCEAVQIRAIVFNSYNSGSYQYIILDGLNIDGGPGLFFGRATKSQLKETTPQLKAN